MNNAEIVETQSKVVALPGANPAVLLQMAVQQGADLDRLERLMALQERWEANEAKKAYNEAFSAFKAEAVRIVKNRIVENGPLSGKRYAELFAVVNAVTPALSKHGLSAAWKLTKDDKDWLEVTCTLKHVGGHTESVSMGGPPDAGGAKNQIMARASTVSYLERYTLKAITGLSEQGDDDDGGHYDPLDQPKYLGLTVQQSKIVRAAAGRALELFNVNDELGAWGEVEGFETNEEKDALWLCLRGFPDLRAAIKTAAEESRARQAALDAAYAKAQAGEGGKRNGSA